MICIKCELIFWAHVYFHSSPIIWRLDELELKKMLSFVVITGYYRNAEIKVNQHLVGFLQVFTFSTRISLRWSMGTQILIFQ